MHRILRAKLLASALALSALPFVVSPVNAQVSVDVSFNAFHDRLSAYGTWVHHPRYGDVWQPRGVDRDFHPYTRGHWANTEYGFTWVSDYAWGDVPFHYGRWVYDNDAWLWVPGYVWAPAWVSWRSDNDYTGWAPLPPDDRFLAGDETNYDVDPVAFYGPRFDAGNFFVFVGTRHIAEPNYRAYVVRRPIIVNIFNRTRNITRISVVNDHVVNRSVDVRLVERVSRRPIPMLSIHAVLRPGAIITNVNVGREIEVRERQQHPRVNPPGNDRDQTDRDRNGKDTIGKDLSGKDSSGKDVSGKDSSGKDVSGKDLSGKDSNDHNNAVTGTPSAKDNAKHDGHPDNNAGTGANTPAANTPASDQTPPKHHKDAGSPDQTPPATTNTPPTDNGAGAMGTSDQTKTKHHKDAGAMSPDQTPPATTNTPPTDSGAGAMGTSDQTKPRHHKDTGAMSPDQTPSGGNATPTDNGANNMGTSDQTPPKRHKANGGTPADQGTPGTGATATPRTLNTPAPQSGDQSATPKPKKKDKDKTDGQQDNSPQ